MPPKRHDPRNRTASGSGSSTRERNISTGDGPNIIPLTSLTHAQIGKALARLQMCAPDGYKAEDCIKILACSKVFVGQFAGYDPSGISAIFDKFGDFIDFKSNDDKISGIFKYANNNFK